MKQSHHISLKDAPKYGIETVSDWCRYEAEQDAIDMANSMQRDRIIGTLVVLIAICFFVIGWSLGQ